MKVEVLPARFWLLPAVFGYCITTIAYNNADFRPPPVVPAPPAVGTPTAQPTSTPAWGDCGTYSDQEECES